MSIYKDIRKGKYDKRLDHLVNEINDRQCFLEDLGTENSMAVLKKKDPLAWEREIIRTYWEIRKGDRACLHYYNDKRKNHRRLAFKSYSGTACWKKVLADLKKCGIGGWELWGEGASNVPGWFGPYLTTGIVKRVSG